MSKIIRVQVLAGYRLDLLLEDGRHLVRDLSHLVKNAEGVLQKLRSERFFRRAKINSLFGCVVWPGDIDIAPETLIRDAEPFAFVE
jgi:hypothetical protein